MSIGRPKGAAHNPRPRVQERQDSPRRSRFLVLLLRAYHYDCLHSDRKRRRAFVFQEATSDFQAVTIQGQFTYRVSDPKRPASLLDFSIDKRHGYCTDDPRKLPERLVHTFQTLTRSITQRLALRDALTSSDAIVAEALAGLKESEAVTTLGVEILSLSILAITPTPETSRALDAEAREAL